ncbi:MAG: hypothetical protein A2W31_11085 [Planctomycetes bacterium RBG_16_64_10]|nr:MAG: hypothetical protein A2W31_11085 [Planctomycetes bacterium RBG_16_64_10]
MLLLPICAACTTTTVTKNPDDCDRGIRYYRPKPYLLIQPTDHHSDEFVTITLQYLPDFSEEYSIRVRAGLGSNQTNIALADGWNLTQIDQKLDSQFDETIKAVADLIKSVPIPTAAPARGAGEPKIVVRATNVPLGFYESVIAPGADGKKRLCGWRYVGFHPFASCPGAPCEAAMMSGDPAAIYALIFERGAMTFRPIDQIEAGKDHDREVFDRETIRRLPPLDETAWPALETIRRRALAYLQQTPWGSTLTPEQLAVQRQGDLTVVVTVRLTAAQRRAVQGDPATAAAQLEAQLLPDVRDALLDDGCQVRVALLEPVPPRQ